MYIQISEDAVNGYTSVKDGNNFTNTINQENNLQLVEQRTWVDQKVLTIQI